MTDPVFEDLLDVEGAAALAKVSAAYIRKRLTLHELRRWHVGRRVFVDRRELQGLVRAAESKPHDRVQA